MSVQLSSVSIFLLTKMFKILLIFVALSLTYSEAHREPWDPDLPQIDDVSLIKGQPLFLEKNYTKFQLKGLTGILYADSFSQLDNVDEIRIFESPQLKGIEPGALCSARSLRFLELDFSSNRVPPVIKKNTFRACENVEELALIFNEVHRPRLSDDSFHNLYNLKELVLRNQNIDHLTKKMFINLKWLKVVILDNCRIQQIDGNLFEGISNLKKLQISHNRGLTYLPRNLFVHTPVLEVLLLMGNRIADLTWDEFEGLSFLKELSLAANRLSYFDADKIARFMPNLERLYIEQNLSTCKKKEMFVNKLQAKMDHPLMVLYRFDPGYYDNCKHDD